VISVTKLSVTPVKGTRLQRVDAVELDHGGARGDRRFFVIDERGRMMNAKQLGELQRVFASCADGRLALRFPDGRLVEDDVALGDEVEARFYSGTLAGRLVLGPWSDALSEHVGRPLRLLEPGRGAVDRGARGGASLISSGSLMRLAAEAGQDSIDSRRFRMLIEIDGVPAHAEDRWVGRTARVGDAVICWGGHVGRCMITSRDPESGVVDLPTLDLLGEYRGGLETTEPLPFGIYGKVLEPGTVRVGDGLELLD
jgi:uncharacterized protein YcbX